MDRRCFAIDSDIVYQFLIAGYGPLSFVVEGAHRSNVECSNEGKGHYVMRYKPHEPGIYMLNVKFGDDHITGKPT